MSSLGIEFLLKADSAQFTKGLATANNKLHDLKKTLREGDLGGGIKRLIGAGAIIEAFRVVIGHAADVRKSLEEMGSSVPENVASVARLSDAFGDFKKMALEAGVSVLSVFTGIGDTIGNVINDMRRDMGAGLIDPKVGQEIQEAADKSVAESEASRKRIMAEQSTESLRAADKNLADVRRKNALAEMTDLQKLNTLIGERMKLEEKLAGINPGTKNKKLIIDTKTAIEAKSGEVAAQRKAVEGGNIAAAVSVGKAQDRLNKESQDHLDSQRDRFLPTVAELAQSQKFGENDPRSVAIENARKVARLEEQATFAGGRGDINGAVDLQNQADKVRSGLGGFAKSSDGVKAAGDSVKLLDDIQKQLVKANTALEGTFKAQ